MSVDKLVDSTQLDADLTSVANAIRTKGGTSASMSFPADFVSAIAAIPSGGGVTAATGTITLAALEKVPSSGSKQFPGLALGFEPDIFWISMDRDSWDDISSPGSIYFYKVLFIRKTMCPPYRQASNISTDTTASNRSHFTIFSNAAIASTDVSSNGYAINGTSYLSSTYQPLWYLDDDGHMYFGKYNTNNNAGFEAGTYRYFAIKV